MISKTKGKSHDRESRIGKARRRKDGRSRHIQVVCAVDSTIGIRDALTRDSTLIRVVPA